MFIMGDIVIHQQQLSFAHFSGDPNDHIYGHTTKPGHYKLVRAKQTKCNVTGRSVMTIPSSVNYTNKALPRDYSHSLLSHSRRNTGQHEYAVHSCFLTLIC